MNKLAKYVLSISIVAGTISGCIAPAPTAPVATPAAAVSETAPDAAPDAVSSASEKETSDPAALVKGLSENGYWIFSITDNVTLDQPLEINGTFNDKGDPAGKVYRKLALNTQDASYQVIDKFTLTVPQMTINSPNMLIQNGTIKGDVVVNAEGLTLTAVAVDGNLTFETQAQRDSATIDESLVTGTVSIAAAQAMTTTTEPVAEAAATEAPAAEPAPVAAEVAPAPKTEPAPAPKTEPAPAAAPAPAPATKPEPPAKPAPPAEPAPAPAAEPAPAPAAEPAPDAVTEATVAS